ncbi:MAG: hypothetical protein HY791_06785 [Deltaproteobacteria bacterium]|nr:hypothetical protein [Deltaproteobacteria bacterium]
MSAYWQTASPRVAIHRLFECLEREVELAHLAEAVGDVHEGVDDRRVALLCAREVEAQEAPKTWGS